MNRYDKILSQTPFGLSPSSIKRVEEIILSMSLEEKVGQLFFLHTAFGLEDEAYLGLIAKYKPGGIMFRPDKKEIVKEKITKINKTLSNVPPFISANLENGSAGIFLDGYSYGNPLQIAASDDNDLAYRVGHMTGVETSEVGVNMTFSPVVDIDMNYRNPITNTRTFGSNVETVAKLSKQFSNGLMENNIMPTIKHFPGDGVDERDQHVLPSVNYLNCQEWEKSYGLVYRNLIQSGVPCVMAGHIMFPAYYKEKYPEIKDENILPGTLSDILLQKLLRDELGFNGLILTDASLMAGFTTFMPRKEALVQSINAGCDMILFTKNLEEDYATITDAIQVGTISESRVTDALIRIIGLKVKSNLLSLSDTKFESQFDEMKAIKLTEECADKGITLVKNNESIIPISPEKYKRVLIISIGNELKFVEKFAESLSENHFDVTIKDNTTVDFASMFESIEDFKSKQDLIIYAVNYQNKSNQTSNRIEWGMPMGQHMPWFTKEVPTLMVSFANPYHLYDAPRISTYVNAYIDNEVTVKQVVDKLVGNSSMNGVSPVDAFCGLWDTRW